MRRVFVLLVLAVAVAHAALFHVRLREPAPDVIGVEGVLESAAGGQLFLAEAPDERTLRERIQAAGARRRSVSEPIISQVYDVQATALSWGQDRIDQR
jgi:hypothetical protein